MRSIQFAAFIWLCTCSLSPARDIYVDNVAGNDLYDGGSPSNQQQGTGPTRTVAKAIRLAHKGDRIVLANTGQPYYESITLQGGRHSGDAGKPFMLIGNGAILDGSRPVPGVEWEYFGGNVFRFRPPHKAYQDLFVDGLPATRQTTPDTKSILALKPLEWSLHKDWVYFCVEPTKLPQTYDMSHTYLTVGLTLYQVRHVEIHDLIVQKFQLDGINAHDSAFNVLIDRVTARGNGRSGIAICGSSNVTLSDCLVGNNGAAQVRCEDYSTTRIVGCELLDNTAPKIVDAGGAFVVEDAVAGNQ